MKYSLKTNFTHAGPQRHIASLKMCADFLNDKLNLNKSNVEPSDFLKTKQPQQRNIVTNFDNVSCCMDKNTV